MAEDLLADRILISPNKLRTLKTNASEREIPTHPRLKELSTTLRDPRFQESCHPSDQYIRGLEDMTNASWAYPDSVDRSIGDMP